jgi:hypothetical protein
VFLAEGTEVDCVVPCCLSEEGQPVCTQEEAREAGRSLSSVVLKDFEPGPAAGRGRVAPSSYLELP